MGKSKGAYASEVKWVNNTTLDISLTPGNRFWNQKPVTAEDVKATYDFFQSTAPEPSPLKGRFRILKKLRSSIPSNFGFI